MKYLRFSCNGMQKWGILEDDAIKEISGSFFDSYEFTGSRYVLDDVKILAPCTPSKVVAVGQNYIDHIKELGHEMPKNPTLFVKLPHTVIGPEENIIMPEYATRVDYEAELAVVMKEECRNVAEDEAYKYILGATCLNDVTERDIQKVDGQWTRAKNFETFCPIGPFISSGLNYDNLGIKLLLNGQIRQNSNTSNLLWSIGGLISFISRVIPLYPGDIVTTGTPSGVGPMNDGDMVEVIIEGIGSLRNFVLRDNVNGR